MKLAAANECHPLLMDLIDACRRQDFDTHVLACILAISIAESLQTGESLNAATGLSFAQLRDLLDARFTVSLAMLTGIPASEPVRRAEEEENIRLLLVRFSTRGSSLAHLLSCLIARRAMRPNHLWQDLGLPNRAELSRLMQTHFEPMARRNGQDMKWKKFFYRMICREEGFTLCAAPVCSECADFDACFGDETGPSLLARSAISPALVTLSLGSARPAELM